MHTTYRNTATDSSLSLKLKSDTYLKSFTEDLLTARRRKDYWLNSIGNEWTLDQAQGKTVEHVQYCGVLGVIVFVVCKLNQ